MLVYGSELDRHLAILFWRETVSVYGRISPSPKWGQDGSIHAPATAQEGGFVFLWRSRELDQEAARFRLLWWSHGFAYALGGCMLPPSSVDVRVFGSSAGLFVPRE